MEFEPWWLLSWPLFFGLGWLAARIDIRQVIKESRSLPRAYLSGLNWLLNDQPDKAIDAFLEAVKIDPQTVELHFALGSLFRRRGDVDRAIRIHRSLLDREDLSAEQRIQACDELGKDYLKAGLLDRAEAVYRHLQNTGQREVANAALLEIYQQEKNWLRAIEVAAEMPQRDTQAWARDVANFHCEVAATALAESRFEEATRHIREALATNRKCVRAEILLGEVLVAQNSDREAVEAWQRVGAQDPAYLALVGERLMNAYRRLGAEEQGMQLLRTYLDQHPSFDLLDLVFQWVVEREGADAAYSLVRDQLKRNPTLLGLDKLLEAAIHTTPIERRADVEMVKGLVHGHTRRVARYRCNKCGFKARQYYWRCPACGGWETYPPKRTEEFDLTP